MDLENLPAGHRLELYVSPECPYCAAAIAHYDERGLPFEVYDAQNDAAHQRRMLEITGGNRTVPAILVDGVYMQSGWGTPPRG